MDAALVTFTSKSVETLLREGGTGNWRVARHLARLCPFTVVVRNARSTWVEGPEPHGSAFLIGRNRNIIPVPGDPNRSLILFSEFARINLPNAWPGGRNPIHYTTLAALGIDPTTLTWEPMPAPVPAPSPPAANTQAPRSLTFAQAKEGLALTYNLAPTDIEITIRV